MNQIFVYDFTLGQELMEKDGLIEWLEEHCKHWVFQLEQGEETGYLHWQGRMSLKSKTRQATLVKHVPKGMHVSPTAGANSTNFNYVMKLETRVDGPWSDQDDATVYVPRQVREIKVWRPWQLKIAAVCKQWDTRVIHVVYDTKGNNGKSVLACALECDNIACYIPFCNDFRDIMRMVMDQKKVGAYIIDMPRAICKDKLGQLWAGLESLKSGFAFDDRYKFKKAWFDSPQIVVMTNKLPDLDCLSIDRWVFWQIQDNDLVEYVPKGLATTNPPAKP